MSQRIRLNKLAAGLTEVGMAGGDMQAKLAGIIQDHDLSPHEISRIVEKANRDTQLGLYKVAQDKRFSFKLLDSGSAIKEARKQASTPFESAADETEKLAFAVYEAGGDPFAAPVDAMADSLSPSQTPLSLFEHPVDEKLAYAQTEHRTRELLLGLDRHREELLATIKEARAAEVGVYDNANQAHSKAIQAALDMIGAGITLPSLTMALYAAVSGSGSGPDATKHTDNILSLIVRGLKERGVPNHRLGFRWDADIDEIEKLSVEDIIAMAKRSAGLPCDHDISMQTQKRAQRYVEMMPDYAKMRPTDQHPFLDAADHLQNRPSVKDFGVAQAYLDDKNVSNTPGGRPKVINGDSEFVIGIRDLVGAQERLTRLHAANEYLGLKVKQIEGAMRGLKTAQLKAAEDLDSRLAAIAEAERIKEAYAFIPALAKGAVALGSSLLGAGKVVGQTVGRTVKNVAAKVPGAANTAANINSLRPPARQDEPNKPPQQQATYASYNPDLFTKRVGELVKEAADAPAPPRSLVGKAWDAAGSSAVGNIVGGLGVAQGFGIGTPKPKPAPKPKGQARGSQDDEENLAAAPSK